MSDLLSSASLLLTVLAILYGLWYPEIKTILEIIPEKHYEDRRPQIKAIREVRNRRVLPLTIASILTAAIYAPDSLQIITSFIALTASRELPVLAAYDAVRASLVMVEIILVGLSWHLTTLFFSTNKFFEPTEPKSSVTCLLDNI